MTRVPVGAYTVQQGGEKMSIDLAEQKDENNEVINQGTHRFY